MNLDLAALGQFAWTQIWQLAVVVLAVTVVTRLGPVRGRPHLCYALWLLVFMKCLTPPLVASPTSPFSWALAEIAAPPAAIESDAASTVADAAPAPTAIPPIREPQQVRRNLPANAELIVAAPNDVPAVEISEPASPVEEAASWLTVGMALVTLWALGAIAYATVALVRLRRISRRLVRDGQRESGNSAALLTELTGAFGLRKSPHVIFTPQPFGPALVGLFQPALVVPDVIRSQLSCQQLRLVLAHELVHLRRRDHWIGLVQFVAQAVWWFNPFVWWANRECNRIREQCCDEEVVARLRCEPAGYAQTLLDILRLGPRLRPVFFASGVRALQVTEERLEHIMSDASRFQRATPRAYWLVVALAGVLLLPGAGLALQADEKRATERKEAKTAQATQTNGATGSANQNRPGDEPKDKYYDHPLTVSGRALDADGKPVPNATIYLVSTNISPARLLGETKTDADGRYEFRDKPLPIRVPANKDFFEEGSLQVFGKAAGRAFAWQGMKHFVVDKRGRSNSTTYLAGQRIELDLTFSVAKHISGRVINEQLNGVAGVELRLANCDYLNRAGRESHKNYREFWAMSQAAEVMPEELRATTDDMGRFRFSSVPHDLICWLLVKHPKYADMSLYTSTADDPPDVHDEGHPVRKLPLLINLREVRTIPVRVVSAASGLPIAGIKVSGYQKRATGTSDYGTSDKKGNVTLRLPPGEYKLLGDPPRGESNDGFVRTYQDLIVAETRDEQPVTLMMDQGCVLVLRAVDADTGKGIPGVNFWYEGDPPPGSRRGVQSSPSYVDHPKTDAKGELRAIVLPGKRRYGAGFGRLPEGYRRLGKFDHLGQELELPTGFEVVAEFKLKKEQPAKVKDAQDHGQRATERPGKDSEQRPANNANSDAVNRTGEEKAAPLTFTGTVIERTTKKPIEGARVTITRHVRKGTVYEVAGTSEHRTDREGRYEFTPGPDLKGHDRFVISSEVEHDQYVSSQGKQLAVDLAEEAKQTLSVRQLEPIETVAAETIRGTIQTPDGKPATALPVIVYSVLDQDSHWSTAELTTRTTTNDQGAFLAKAAQTGEAVVWVESDGFSPLALDLGGKRGDLGTHRLEKGVRLSGQVLDHSGKPVAGVLVRATLKNRIVFQVARPYGGDHMHRHTTTDAEGRFRLAPLRPGDYDISIDTSTLQKERTVALAPVFPSSSFRLSEDNHSVEIQAAEIVTIDVRCVDTSDRPVAGVRVSLSGDDFYHSRYHTAAETDKDGWAVLAWPKGYRATLSVFGGNREYVYRAKQDASPPGDRDHFRLGGVDKDLRNIEVVQYKAATLIVKGVNNRGEPVADFRPEIRYSATPANMGRYVARGWRTDVSFTKLADGRWQSERLWPQEDFTISASGSDFQSDSQKIKLPEGESAEITLRLMKR